MMTFDLAKTVRRVGLASFLALAIAAPFSPSAKADEIDDLRNELQQLKQQVTFLQNQIPQGGAVASGGGTSAAQTESASSNTTSASAK